MEFSVSALEENGTVTLVKGADISLALSFERTTGKGSVTITPEDTFGDESSFNITAAIGELRYLKALWIIGDEGISGSIPSSFGNLTELRDLSISGTSVSGPIPFCLSSLKKLEILGLDGNRLTGNIPLFLRDLPALYNFGFSQNCMDGKIDPSLTETLWWNTVDTSTGRKMGKENLARGQKEGHALWL